MSNGLVSPRPYPYTPLKLILAVKIILKKVDTFNLPPLPIRTKVNQVKRNKDAPADGHREVYVLALRGIRGFSHILFNKIYFLILSESEVSTCF